MARGRKWMNYRCRSVCVCVFLNVYNLIIQTKKCPHPHCESKTAVVGAYVKEEENPAKKTGIHEGSVAHGNRRRHRLAVLRLTICSAVARSHTDPVNLAPPQKTFTKLRCRY